MKDIPGLEGRYAINEDGTKVWSYPKSKKMWQGGIGWTKGRFLTIVNRKYNYKAVTLSIYKNNKRCICSMLIHRLVALTYIGIPNDLKMEVNHKDKNPANNHFSNLEWVTREDNVKHSWQTGRKQPKWKLGRINLPTKLSLNQIKKIRNLYKKGINRNQISKILNIHSASVYHVLKGKGCYALTNKQLEKEFNKI